MSNRALSQGGDSESLFGVEKFDVDRALSDIDLADGESVLIQYLRFDNVLVHSAIIDSDHVTPDILAFLAQHGCVSVRGKAQSKLEGMVTLKPVSEDDSGVDVVSLEAALEKISLATDVADLVPFIGFDNVFVQLAIVKSPHITVQILDQLSASSNINVQRAAIRRRIDLTHKKSKKVALRR